MRRPSILGRFCLIAMAGAALTTPLRAQSSASGSRSSDHWVGTWGSSPVGRAPLPAPAAGQAPGPAAGAPAAAPPAPAPQPPLNFNNQTLRLIVHTSIGGDRVRVVFSNAFGTARLAIGGAHVAVRQKGPAIVPASDRALTFGGAPTTDILPGAVVVSDAVDLAVPALGDLAIDLYLPGNTAGGTSPLTTRNGAGQTSYVSPEGNHLGKADMPVMTTTLNAFFVARVEVMAPAAVGAVVGFGDSITAGARSTPDTNNAWLDQLARRLSGSSSPKKMAVLNAGIPGNRVLADGAAPSALARFDRDVLLQTGVTHVIVLHGNNDLGARQNPPGIDELIAAHKQLIERAHARGLTIIGGTLTPFEGSTLAVWTPEAEKKRLAFNEWIRTSKAYDGVIDFDRVMRDANAPSKLPPPYNSGDNLHPNDAGYQVMGNAVDLALFEAARATR